MAVSFNKQQQIHGRYQMLSPQPVSLDGADMSRYDGQEYATFIKSLNAGSMKTHDKLSRPKINQTVIKQSRTPNADSSTKGSSKGSSQGVNSTNGKIQNGVQTVNQIKIKNAETHRKKMKIIEDYMFQCKQQERELKRVEGDIIKKEHNVKKTMKNYEAEIYNDKRQQEKQLTVADKEQDIIKKQYYIEDEKLTKEKINRNINTIQKEKESDSKSTNTLNGLEFRYETIAKAISLKRTEVNSLVSEFENKVRQKEEEEFRLKKEFANISLELNMAAQKQRLQTDADERNNNITDQRDKNEQLRKGDHLQERLRFQADRVNHAEKSKRRLSKDLQEVVGTLSMQEREEGRRLQDVKSKLYDNSLSQKEAQIKAELLEMERKGILSDEKIMTVTSRRKAIQDLITQQRKQKNDLSMDEWRQRNFAVNHEAKKQDVQDSISHFQKGLDKQDEVEHALYNQVRQLESERRKQEQQVLRMREELTEAQKQNKILLRDTALRCQQQELELQQRLQKEEAQLGRALSEREERIVSLAQCRSNAKEDRHMLEEERKVQDRLLRIEKKSNILRSQQSYQNVY